MTDETSDPSLDAPSSPVATRADVRVALRQCPICGKPTQPRTRPFCSTRCADLDLGRWLTESYRVPVGADDDEDGESDAPPTSPSTDRPNPDRDPDHEDPPWRS